MRKEQALEEFAMFEHGNLVKGHAYGAYYNWRTAGRIDGWVLFHLIAGFISLFGFHTHYKRVRGRSE